MFGGCDVDAMLWTCGVMVHDNAVCFVFVFVVDDDVVLLILLLIVGGWGCN